MSEEKTVVINFLEYFYQGQVVLLEPDEAAAMVSRMWSEMVVGATLILIKSYLIASLTRRVPNS